MTFSKKLGLIISVFSISSIAKADILFTDSFNINPNNSVGYLDFSLNSPQEVDIYTSGLTTDPQIYLFQGSASQLNSGSLVKSTDDDGCSNTRCGQAGSYENALIDNIALSEGDYTVAVSDFRFTSDEAINGENRSSNLSSGQIDVIVATSDTVTAGEGSDLNVPEENSDLNAPEKNSDLNAPEENSEVVKYLGSSRLSGTSASVRSSQLVFSRLVDPIMRTHIENEEENGDSKVKVFMTDVKYEHGKFNDDSDNSNGHIAGLTAGASIDIGRYTLGMMLPYDYMDFDSFKAHRTGIILYGQSKWNFTDNLSFGTTINGNYLYSAVSSKVFTANDLHTVGGGLSASLKYDNKGDFVPRFSISYQTNKDYTKSQTTNSLQHLIKAGSSLGYRIGKSAIIRVSAVYTRDVSSQYSSLNQDNDYVDVGVEGSWSISKDWQIKGGYNRMVALDTYVGDQVYLGSNYRF